MFGRGNNLLSLFVFTLASFGLAFVIGQSKISLPIRMVLEPESILTFSDSLRAWLLALMECPACLGFWFGLFYAWFVSPMFFPGPHSISIVGFGLYACGANFVLSQWTLNRSGEEDD